MARIGATEGGREGEAPKIGRGAEEKLREAGKPRIRLTYEGRRSAKAGRSS